MTGVSVTESVVEDAALAWLAEHGYTILHGPDIAPGELAAEREQYGEMVLSARLKAALGWRNDQGYAKCALHEALPSKLMKDVIRLRDVA